MLWLGVHPQSRRGVWRKYLSSSGLSNKAISRSLSSTVRPQTQALDVSVRGRSIFARIALDFADVDHLGFLAAAEDEEEGTS